MTSSSMPLPAPLAPFETLFDDTPGTDIPLPDALAALYGQLRLPAPAGRPHVLGNFVTTLDGVVALDDPATGGGAISGYNRNDRALMGLLRAVADAVVVAAGTLRADARHLWTPAGISPISRTPTPRCAPPWASRRSRSTSSSPPAATSSSPCPSSPPAASPY